MSLIDHIINAINSFWEAISGIISGVTDKVDEFGGWLFGGLAYLSERVKEAIEGFGQWFYSGLEWLSNKLKEGYESLATWISGGLSWIGSGLSWIGQQFYNFGQWVWNGIIWVCRTIASEIESFVNWLWDNICDIWNGIVDFINGWIEGLNEWINNWIKELRRKFSNFIIVNLTLPATFKSFDKFVANPNVKSFIGLFATPLVASFLAQIIDSIIPSPKSEKVVFFPSLAIPKLDKRPIIIEKPDIPEKPVLEETPKPPLYPPIQPYKPIIEVVNSIKSVLIYNITFVRSLEKFGNIRSEYEISKEIGKPIFGEGKILSNYDVSGEITHLAKCYSYLKTLYDIIIPVHLEIGKIGKLSADLESKIFIPESGFSLSFGKIESEIEIELETRTVNLEVYDLETNTKINKIRIYFDGYYKDFINKEIIFGLKDRFKVFPLPLDKIYKMHEYEIKYIKTKNNKFDLELEFKNELGMPLTNAIVRVNGKEYRTDNNGRIVLKDLNKNQNIKIEVEYYDYYKKFIFRVE